MAEKKTDGNRKRYGRKEAAFLNRTPIYYRRTVVAAFRKFTLKKNNNEMGRPERIIEEISDYLGEDINEVYDRYYEKIRNLRKGTNAIFNDEEFFLLVEQFVMKYCPEQVSGTNVISSTVNFGEASVRFYSDWQYHWGELDQGKHEIFQRNRYDEVDMEYLKVDTIYKVNFEIRRSYQEYRNAIADVHPSFKDSDQEVATTYFLIKDIPDKKYSFVVSFIYSDEINLHFGTFDKARGFIFLKSLETNHPSMINIYYDDKTKTSSIDAYPSMGIHGIGRAANIFEMTFSSHRYVMDMEEVHGSEFEKIDNFGNKILADMDLRSLS